MNNSTFVSHLGKRSDRPLHKTVAAWALAPLAMVFALTGCSSSTTTNAGPVSQPGAIAFTDANGNPAKAVTALTVGTGVYLDAVVSNDPQLLGVNWSISCTSQQPQGTPLPPGQTVDESCGTFAPTHTASAPVPSFATTGAGIVTFYQAPVVPPKLGTVTLYASSTSDPSKFSSVTFAIDGLPISIGFAPAPPSSLAVNGTANFGVLVSNDYTAAGAKWTATCGSSACGSFTSTQTLSGVSTTYTAPASVPVGNIVNITATSLADSTKAVTSAVTILPITTAVSPMALPVSTNGSESLYATVANDMAERGVDWVLSCTNTLTPGACGSITAHTASGEPAIYTAPSSAAIGPGTVVVAKATSSTDKASSATATISTQKGALLTGTVTAAHKPVSGASVSLYAATSSDPMQNSLVAGANSSATAITYNDGSFTIPYGYLCPSPSSQMYLISSGGDAGAGNNSNLTMMVALGACASLDASPVVVDEATTVASAYALSRYFAEGVRVGSSGTPLSSLANAFTLANKLVDVTTGQARSMLPGGEGSVPQARIDTLANLLSACAVTAGATLGDGSACDRLFAATNVGSNPAAAPTNTLQAMLHIAGHASSTMLSSSTLFELAASIPSLQPALTEQPADWAIGITVPIAPDELVFDNHGIGSDSFGNLWVRNATNLFTEFVGASPSPSANVRPVSTSSATP